MGVLWAIVAQLAKLHLQEFIKDCQQPKRFLYLCTFPVLQPVQHYLVGVCSSRSWIIKFTNVSVHKREPPQKLGEGTKLLTSSAQGPPSQLNHHVLSPRSVLMFSVLAQSCLWLKLSGRMLLVRLEKIHQTLGEEGRFTP